MSGPDDKTPSLTNAGDFALSMDGGLARMPSDDQRLAAAQAAQDTRVDQMYAAAAAKPDVHTPTDKAMHGFVKDSHGRIPALANELPETVTTMSAVPFLPQLNINLPEGLKFNGSFATITDTLAGGSGINSGKQNFGVSVKVGFKG